MAGLNVGELYAKLGLETKEFRSGVKTAKKEAKELGKTVKSDMTGSMKTAPVYVNSQCLEEFFNTEFQSWNISF